MRHVATGFVLATLWRVPRLHLSLLEPFGSAEAPMKKFRAVLVWGFAGHGSAESNCESVPRPSTAAGEREGRDMQRAGGEAVADMCTARCCWCCVLGKTGRGDGGHGSRAAVTSGGVVVERWRVEGGRRRARLSVVGACCSLDTQACGSGTTSIRFATKRVSAARRTTDGWMAGQKDRRRAASGARSCRG